MMRSDPGSLRFSRWPFCAFCSPRPWPAPAPRPAAAAPRRRAAPPPPAPPAASAACGACADALVVRDPGRRLLRQLEAADLVERLHLAVGQRHDAEARLRLARPAVAAAAALSWFRFGSGWVLVRVWRVVLFLFTFRLRGCGDDDARLGRGTRGPA